MKNGRYPGEAEPPWALSPLPYVLVLLSLGAPLAATAQEAASRIPTSSAYSRECHGR